jgi:hypothetical protein
MIANNQTFLVRIPAHHDRRFRANVITCSGDGDRGFRAS